MRPRASRCLRTRTCWSSRWSHDDAWIRDCGPTFVVNDEGGVRAVHWHFNAWGGLYDGLYFPWDQDALIGMKVADLAHADRYRPDQFVLEGGSIHVDGEGTVITTEMCLLSPGRNPELSKEDIEGYLREYLNVEKVIWIKDGIDPDETNGHIDDVACFVAPGEAACIWTDDEESPFYEAAHAAYETLSQATDAKGRQLKVHKLVMPKELTYMTQEEVDAVDVVEGTLPHHRGLRHRLLHELSHRQRRRHRAAVRRRVRRAGPRPGTRDVPRSGSRGRVHPGSSLRRRQHPLHHPARASGKRVGSPVSGPDRQCL